MSKGETDMNGSVKENLARRGIWLRLVFMLVLGFAFYVAEVIVFTVTAFQFLCSLFSGQPNRRLLRLGRGLARYLQQITVYWTFATEEKPFPFAAWPDEPDDEAAVGEAPKQLSQASAKSGDGAEKDEAGEAENSADTESAADADSADGRDSTDSADSADSADKAKD